MSFTKWSLEATKSYIVLFLLKYVFYEMVSGSYQIKYCLVLTQVCLLQNGLWKLPNHILSCSYSSMSFTKWSLEATKSYIVLSLFKYVFYNMVSGITKSYIVLSLLKYVFYKMVTGSYQIIYCLVLTQVCLLQNGLCKLPNHILSCPYSSMYFTNWTLEATKSYMVLSLLKYVFYKMVSGSYQIIYCLVLTQVCLLQNGLWKLPNHILSCPYSSMSFTKWSLQATKSYIVLSLLKYVLYKMVSGSYQIIYSLILTQVCLLQNGLTKLPNHVLPCPSSSMSFTKRSLEATKSYIVLSLLKYVFYKMVSGSYQIIYCLVLTQVGPLQNDLWNLSNHILSCPSSSMSLTKRSLEATKSYIVLSLLKYVFYKMVSRSYQIMYCLVLPQVCLLQKGLWKLPNHILSCPYSSMSFTKWSLEATKSYIVLFLLKYVLYKMVSGSYQIIYCLVLTQGCLLQNGLWKLPNHILSCPYSSMSFTKGLWKLPNHILYCPYSSMSFTKWSLEATKSYIVFFLLK